MTALIGYTGLVGSNLARQFECTELFRSHNIGEIRGRSFDLVLCAGIQAKKWWANEHAEEDRAGIRTLLDALAKVHAGRFVLISTVDVYPTPAGVDETTPIDPDVNHAYGRNRFEAERFVRERFPDALVMRLPGLFGTGLKKNVIFDLLHDHELHKINPAGVYQYYSLDRLRPDIERAWELGIRLLNLATEPVPTREIVERFFPDKQTGPETPFRAAYDMRSVHGAAWSGAGGYLYSRETVLGHLEAYLRREHGVGAP